MFINEKKGLDCVRDCGLGYYSEGAAVHFTTLEEASLFLNCFKLSNGAFFNTDLNKINLKEKDTYMKDYFINCDYKKILYIIKKLLTYTKDLYFLINNVTYSLLLKDEASDFKIVELKNIIRESIDKSFYKKHDINEEDIKYSTDELIQLLNGNIITSEEIILDRNKQSYTKDEMINIYKNFDKDILILSSPFKVIRKEFLDMKTLNEAIYTYNAKLFKHKTWKEFYPLNEVLKFMATYDKDTIYKLLTHKEWIIKKD